MLEVRCGKADRSHENTFFRYFASEVKAKFDALKIDGLLLGMPYCLVKENLQLDALLITDSSITIIDFKDYSDCTITLPAESDFEKGRWSTDRGFFVKGGSSPNPFSQQQFQRRALREILGVFCRNKMGDFDIGHITSVVCFTGSVTVLGSIPGRNKLTFSVADGDSFLERLYDIVNVRSAGLLKSAFFNEMLDKLFEAEPYVCSLKPSKPEPAVEVPVGESVADDSFDFIKRFLSSDEDVLILHSTDPSKRMDAAAFARESAHESGFVEAKILSSTKLAGDNLCSMLDVDGSLYSEIYDFASRTRDDSIGMDRIPLAKHISLLDEDQPAASPEENSSQRSVFIVCEGQLVSNSLWATGPVLMGSGHLLSDALEYLGIDGDNSGVNKLIVIGDECQLGANSATDSSLHTAAYPTCLKVLREPLAPLAASGPIDDVVCNLAECMKAGDFSLLSITGCEGDCQSVSIDADERGVIEDAVDNWQTHKIVTSTNAQAYKLNSYIKRVVVRNGEALAPGDVLVMNEQVEAVASGPFSEALPVRRIRNGEFVKVARVDSQRILLSAQDENSSDTVTIARIAVLPEGCKDEYEISLPLEYLYSDKGDLSRLQEIAVRVRLDELEKAYKEEHPFAQGNPLFDEMVRRNDYEEIKASDGSVRYRSAKDKRRLTPEEAEYRRQMRLSLMGPGTEYHSLSNLAKGRFGWAVTAHKSRSYRWEEVTVSANAEMGKNTDAYFRYLYTGFSRAVGKLNVMRWEDVSPFAKAVFDEHPANVRKKAARQVLMRESDASRAPESIKSLLEAHCHNGIRFTHKSSAIWSDSFFVSDGSEEAVIVFDRNKSGDIFAPRLERGSTNLLAKVAESLSDSPEADENAVTTLGRAYDFLCSLANGKMKITIVKVAPYRDDVLIEYVPGSCFAAVYHGADRMVSKVEFQSGDMETFRKVSALTGNQQ